MKRITLALLAAVGLTAGLARADHVTVRGSINIGTPVYETPGYVTPVYTPAPIPRGYWTNVTREFWVPGRWVVSRDRWGRPIRFWEAPHRECRTERVWVDGFARYDDHHRGHGRWNG